MGSGPPGETGSGSPGDGGGTEGVRRARPVTITDIARVTGVVPSTVSRALNKPGRVNPATRDRIQAAARELNYVPNSQARALISGRTGTIAVLVSDVTNPFYFGLIRGAQQRLKATGYAQLLIDTEDSGEHEAEMLHKMRRSLDGAILAASRLPEGALTTLAGEIPLVTVNRNVRGVQSVVIDTPTGIGLAVEHLVNLGHRDIVYVAGPDTAWSNRARWRSMCAAGERYGHRFRQVGPFPRGRRSGTAAADAVLAAGATACICFNDLFAIGMLPRLRERGVDVPGDLSVIGCDDIFGADFCHPPLTTLTGPIEQAGEVAVAMLLARLDEPTTEPVRRTVILPATLTIRESTGPAPDRPAAR
ncbi:LacI family transcriptional regulator [Micromonospora sp. NBC_01699]|uniref:LacI family DNA-binding transcriptional regulator n=1 Tax=Micromonospora sp. NBC_01699 TaxID=2975984 RepID=UPI002E2C573B|nr:LacI family DNA-binding transcriptional regulator [Micromonospora sp. NBC_01699]